MSGMRSAVSKAPGIYSTRSYRYKWVVRGYWDFLLRRAGAAPGITWEEHHTVRMAILDVAVVRTIMLMVVAVSSTGNWHP